MKQIVLFICLCLSPLCLCLLAGFFWMSPTAGWCRLAEVGDAASQTRLGVFYLANNHFAQGVEWLEKAAHQGDPEAQTHLAACWQHGKGLGQDMDKAMEWYRRAAKQGFRPAREALSRIEIN